MNTTTAKKSTVKSTTASKKALTIKDVANAAKKPARQHTRKAAAAKKSTTKKPAASTRNFLDQSMKIVKKVNGNPRREGTEGFKSFSKIKTGMTVEQFVSKGGRLRDLHWDLDHKYVELKRAS